MKLARYFRNPAALPDRESCQAAIAGTSFCFLLSMKRKDMF